MTERLEHHPLYTGDRHEYDTRRNGLLFEPAIEAIEELLAHREGLASHSYKDGKSVRSLSVYGAYDSVDVDDEIVYSDLSRSWIERNPMSTEAQIVLEEYPRGSLETMASLCIREFIGNSPYPLFREYRFEAHGRAVHFANLTTNNVLEKQGAVTQLMTPYDYSAFASDVDAVALSIQQMIETRVQ